MIDDLLLNNIENIKQNIYSVVSTLNSSLYLHFNKDDPEIRANILAKLRKKRAQYCSKAEKLQYEY